MPCYVASAPRATRSHPYHAGFGPFFGGRASAVSPFADFAGTLQPFFRLLDEELTSATTAAAASRPLRSFQPRFDVREDDAAYHLQGELPGIDQKDISIEFKDENTLVVSGRTVREAQQNADDSAPAAATAAETEQAAAPTSDAASETGSSYQKPTVEDEFVDVASESETPASTVTAKDKEVERAAEATAPQQQQQQPQKPKYWVSERSVGQFHRSFTFPGHINQDAVTASLKNGVLNVVVPKAAQKEPRRINIE